MLNESTSLAIPTTPPPGSAEGAAEGFELFHTPAGRAFADICTQGVRQTLPVSSDAFRRWLQVDVCEIAGKAPSSAELKRQVGLLEAKALQPGTPEREVHLRTAFADGRIYLDLCDSSWRAVEVGPDGWRLTYNPPVRFIREPGMSALPVPAPGGSIETLRSLVNISDETDFVLLVAWLVDALHNEGGHPILVLSGAEGTAKSTLVAILKALIDPSSKSLSGLPRTEHELATQVGLGYLQAFDNVRGLSGQMSDALCRLSTGGGARPIFINGIDDVVTRPDLADRCLFVTCDAIPDERRRSEVQLRADFEKAHPQLLALLLDALSHGLRMLPTTKPNGLPRMADFALWATACETAIWPAGTFMAVYHHNIAQAVETLIETDAVASAVRSMMVERKTWTGTAAKLFITLTPAFSRMGGKVPASPRDLAVKLRKAATPLGKIGITVEYHLQGHNRDRIITISSEPKGGDDRPPASTTTSAASSPPPPPSSSPFSSSASSATDQDGDTTTAEPNSAPAAATDAAHHNTPSELADSGQQASHAGDADDADDEIGPHHINNSVILSRQIDVGDRSIPVYRRKRHSRNKQSGPPAPTTSGAS